MNPETQRQSLIPLTDKDITVSHTQTENGLELFSGLLSGERYHNKEDCEAAGSEWTCLGECFCQDSGTGDWD